MQQEDNTKSKKKYKLNIVKLLSKEICFFEQFACGYRENFQFINHILYLQLSYLKQKKNRFYKQKIFNKNVI